MLIRTKLYNHNYYPIRVNTLNERILSDDKQTTSTKQSIGGTTFDNATGALIKPFQNTEQLTAINLNNNDEDFRGNIYLDSTAYTDNSDYETFGILSGQKMNIKHHFVTVRSAKETINIDFIYPHMIDNLSNDSIIELKQSMKDISDQEQIMNHFSLMGFNDYEIEDYDYFGEGLYNIRTIKEIPEDCFNFSDNPNMVRGDVIYTQDTLEKIIDSDEGSKLSIYKQDNNVQFHLFLKPTALKTIYENIPNITTDSILDVLKSDPNQMPLPIYQQAMGINVILQLKTNTNKTPYKLNLKVVTPLHFFTDIVKNNIPDELEETITPIKPFLINPMKNKLSNIMCTPLHTRLLTNPESTYNSKITLTPNTFSQFPDSNVDDSFFTITNIKQKNNDDIVQNSKIQLVHESLPVKTVIPYGSISNQTFPVFVETFGISTDYSNYIVIDYEYGDSQYSIECKVDIIPVLEKEKAKLDNLYIRSEESTVITIDEMDLHFNIKNNDDRIHITFNNIGETDAIIEDIELVNAYTVQKELGDSTPTLITDIINEHETTTINIINDSELRDKNITIDDVRDKELISNYIQIIKNDASKQPETNAFKTNTIHTIFDIKYLKCSKNYINGFPIIIKVVYKDKNDQNSKTIYLNKSFQFITGDISIGYDKKIEEPKYIRPNTKNSLQLNLQKEIKYPSPQSYMGKATKYGISITNVKILNYNNQEYSISDDEHNINATAFPIGITGFNADTYNPICYDVNLKSEKMYKYKARVYTNSESVPYIDIPLTTISTSIDVDAAIQFNPDDFYVRNDKYYMSLVKLQSKKRFVEIINTSPMPFVISEIEVHTVKDRLGATNLDMDILSVIPLPYTLTNKNRLKLEIEFIGKDYGHFNAFIVLKTNVGDAYMHIAAYVNTKFKDVYIMMENAKGTNFVSPLNGIDTDFLKLTNFGDDPSFIDIQKLGYDKEEFLIQNKTKLQPNRVNYIQNLFAPTSTGMKISWLDIKIKDMLETFRLYENDSSASFKIQNSHILAEMVGIALTDHALPYFSRSVVDFGYIADNTKDHAIRVDTFQIKNCGLTPFVITKITKGNPESPFNIPLVGIDLPMKVEKIIELPICINNQQLKNNQSLYIDTLKFEIQDLKSKRIFNYEMIVKVELTDTNKEYMSFNSDFIQFGYCEINHFKNDDIIVKNFSTDKVTVAISYTGNNEIQTLDGVQFNLQPNQKFTVPIYFYPHGIDTFDGKLIMNFNNDNYIKEIDLIGLGVDFKSPLVTIENQLADYYKQLTDFLEN